MSFDIAVFFNSIYHHDLVAWFAELKVVEADLQGFSQALREMNSGRSIDCLPQGLYPTKMIGNDFLRFVDNYFELKSSKLVRFMDDIYLFSDNKDEITNDFQIIQRLLGDKGLSVNPQKTREGPSEHVKMDKDIDEVKVKLLGRRRLLIMNGYDEEGFEMFGETIVKISLSDKELSYVDDILSKPDIDEDDAELILTIMGDHARRVESRLPDILRKFPHLTKSVYNFCGKIDNKEFLAETLSDSLKSSERLMEFQVFWFAAILEDHCMGTTRVSELLDLIFNHRSATSITKAKILEIADSRFGLPDLRNQYLQSGQSDWLAWSSAVGSRNVSSISRNYVFRYFSTSSNMNRLIAQILSK